MAENRKELTDRELGKVSAGTDGGEKRYTFKRGDRYVDRNWKYQVLEDASNVTGDTIIRVFVYLYMRYYGADDMTASELTSYEYAGNFEFVD